MNSNFYALAAAMTFAMASVAFTHFARRASPIWMTAFKAVVALITFGIAAAAARQSFNYFPNQLSFSAFLLSGFIGLGLGDIFLLRSFASIGSARTLILFSFEPLIVGVLSIWLFHQPFSMSKLVAILFMIGCVFTVSFEKFKKEGHWDLRGPVFALLGMLHDACGILLTRFAFDSDRRLSVFEGNFYRCVGAVLGFVLVSQFRRFQLWKTFTHLSSRAKWGVVFASLLGTFISLSLYLTAISRGDLAKTTAIGGSVPIFAALVESIVLKKWPSRYLYLSITLFAIGFYLLL